MDSNNKAFIKKVEWKDVRKEFAAVNSELAAIIDEIDPGPDYPLYKARYPFGSEILKEGYLQIPNDEGELISLKSANKTIREDLGYNLDANPVTVPLTGCVELFLQNTGEHVIPATFSIVPPGKIFGLWRIISSTRLSHPIFIWGMTAGARSLVMLPKITKSIAHKKLQRALHITADVPQTLGDHWEIFREIDQHYDIGKPWTTELLFFSKQWFRTLKSQDNKWLKLNNYLLQSAWDSSEFWRNEYIWDALFSEIEVKKNIKPVPYYFKVIKHLITIGVGGLPGLAPAIDDSVAPISKIKKAYTDFYNMDYAPIIMQPAWFSLSQLTRPVYYSLSFPNNFTFSKRNKILSNKIIDLDQISYLLNKILVEIASGGFNLEETAFYDVAKNVNFDFFHCEVGRYHTLRSSKEIPIEDLSFGVNNNKTDNKKFPENSPFVCGCIRISSKISK